MSDTAAPSVLLTEDRGAVRIVRLNRPDKMNALNTALTQALLDALTAADADPNVRAIVLCGAGRAFCAGADLAEFKDLTPDQQDRVTARADLTCRTQSMLQKLSKPVVAAVHGVAMGGGAGLAIGSDMVVAASEAVRFGYPELKHSIVPALVMTGLVHNLGRKAAFELVSLGRILNGAEMIELGIANRLAPAEEVEAEAVKIAEQWAAANPRAMAAAKSLFYRVADLPYDAAMAAGKDVNALMRSFREAGQ
ncbi:MAG: enoyl-CoA hydratase/isomerase family protein [Pseudolabrys sp.]|nr:enoyl-CoA hydratase/isomerase family protein [Pseudolabrys sp.]